GERLVVEHQRIQGLDPYGVLMIDHAATPREIAAAHAALSGRFDRESHVRPNAAGDLAKLDELIAAYGEARAMLLDENRRAALDRQLGAERRGHPPTVRGAICVQAAAPSLAWLAPIVV